MSKSRTCHYFKYVFGDSSDITDAGALFYILQNGILMSYQSKHIFKIICHKLLRTLLKSQNIPFCVSLPGTWDFC